jgi:acetyl esterase/lipase
MAMRIGKSPLGRYRAFTLYRWQRMVTNVGPSVAYSKWRPTVRQKPDRRTFLRFLATGAVSAAWPRPAHLQEVKPRKLSYTYKTAANCEIKADVYQCSGRARPVVISIHGGALIMGNRGQVDRTLLSKLLESGYTVVSIDYRLAPETKLPEILEDLQDACRWVRERGPELFSINPEKVAVMGGSAGGYLTLSSGFRVRPAPSVLVSFWGYGDIAGKWLTQPDPFYRQLPLVSKEEAFQAVSGPVVSESSGRNNRQRFYLYCRQQGIWSKEVTGHDPDRESKAFDAFCPIRNVSAQFPPTMLVHGTKDTDVPYEQSAIMDKELQRKGVEHEFITVPGGGHGLGGTPREVVSRMQNQVLAFLKRHLEVR